MAPNMNVDFQNCFIFILLCFFSLLFYSLFFKKLELGCDLPPSLPSLPIIGHLHLLLSVLIHKSFQKLSSKYGPFLYLRIFNVPMVLVSSSSISYEIFKTHDMNVSFRVPWPPPVGESLLFGSSTFLMAPHGDYGKIRAKGGEKRASTQVPFFWERKERFSWSKSSLYLYRKRSWDDG